MAEQTCGLMLDGADLWLAGLMIEEGGGWEVFMLGHVWGFK